MSQDTEIVLLHFTGPDFPGQLAAITELFTEFEAEFLDVQQTTSLGQLSLSLLVKISVEKGLSFYRQLNRTAKEYKLYVDFLVLEPGDIVRDEERKNFALTVLADKIETQAYNALVKQISAAGMNIMRMNRLSQGAMQCIEIILGLLPEQLSQFKSIKRDLFKVAFEYSLDLAMQPENLYRKSKRLIVMDMDSTLIQQEVIDEIADFAGVKKQVSEITEQAMRGELDFKESLKKRVSYLKGINVNDLEKVLSRIQLTPGVENLIFVLKKLGFKIAVISGGFTYFTGYFHEKLGLDYHFANVLEQENDKLTGRLTGEIVDRAAKATLLCKLAEQEKIPLGQTVAVGDGANDLDMLEAAGFGIAFNAKPKVKEQAEAFISKRGLDSILYLMGVSEKEISEILAQSNSD